MTTATINFLAYKEFTPRGISALQRATAKLREESNTEEVIFSKLKYVYRDQAGKQLLVYGKTDKRPKYLGRVNTNDEAKAMQDAFYGENKEGVRCE